MKIFKQIITIRDTQFITVPVGSKILKFGVQDEQPVVWYSVGNEEEMTEVRIEILGTGYEFNVPNDLKYFDTLLFVGGSLVFHVFA